VNLNGNAYKQTVTESQRELLWPSLSACSPHHLPSQPAPGFDPRDRCMDRIGNGIKKNNMKN